MIGKRAAEHGVVANLCIPDRCILVVTSYLSFHFYTSKLEAIALRVHEGCGLNMTRSQFFYHKSLQIRASTKILPSEKYPLYGMWTPTPITWPRLHCVCGLISVTP